MSKELSEETNLNISIKSLIGIGIALSTLIGMWFALQADIQEAKELPKPDANLNIYRLTFCENQYTLVAIFI